MCMVKENLYNKEKELKQTNVNSDWTQLFRKPLKPKLTRKIVSSAKLNLNRYWHKFEDLLTTDKAKKPFEDSTTYRLLPLVNKQLKSSKSGSSTSLLDRNNFARSSMYKHFNDESLYHGVNLNLPRQRCSCSILPSMVPAKYPFSHRNIQLSFEDKENLENEAMEMEVEPRVAILQDLRLQSFDAIRFASYRTASKLRYIQKSTNLHLVDIWNVIEAFRENGLNTLEPQSEVSVARLETLVSSLYHNLNKRLPTRDQVPVDSKAGLLLNWLIAAYSNDNSGKIRVFSIKVALAVMCSGKLVDKLRYIFSQISDGAGQLVQWKLCEFLREILALPAAVYESPTFHYKDGLESEMFSLDSRVTVNDFIGVLVNEPGPPGLVWLPLLQRLATVESIVHPIICSVCHKENFSGFRYRCTRCNSYQLCQECFWHGRVSLSHQNDHEVKEYTSYKSPTKQIGHSLRKSFRCVPEKSNHVLPRFPEQPEKTLNLSHIVPPSPLPSHNGFDSGLLAPFDRSSTLDSRATGRSLDSAGASLNRASTSNDEEHRLIARYAARLAQESRTPASSSENASLAPDNSQAQRQLIAQLESKNKEIMREIARLRRQQEAEQLTQESPALMNELRALRQRKGELEGHLGALQDSRRQLMVQLEGLMRMLKSQQTSSPRSTPNSSPRSGKSPPMPQGPQQQQQQQVRNQMQPHSGQISQGTTSNHSEQISGAFVPQNGSVRGRGDLHFAADSVTSAMSTLVRELNTGESDEESSNNIRKQIDFEESKGIQQDWNDMGNANT